MAERLVLAFAVALLMPALPAAQQQSTAIRGTVIGPGGEPVGGAIVSLLDRLGLAIATAHSGADGRFTFKDVSPGTYTVFAEAPPQRSAAQVLTLHAALPVDVDLRLVPGLSESVIVQAATDPPPVTTRMTLSGAMVRATPARLRNRGVQQALATLPGWASEDNGLLHVRGVDDGFLYVEDGVPVYDRIDATFGIAPDPTAIGAMQVLTGYLPPEFGLKSGLSGRYESGTPLEVEEDELDELAERVGSDLVDFDRRRVRPRTVIDMTVEQALRLGERPHLSLRLSVLNLTDHRHALNFGNPFSGTHFGAPRTFLLELRLAMR